MANLEGTETEPRTEIQWSKYAEHYDQMCAHNPSYEDMIQLVAGHALSVDLPARSQVLDVGAGTGNLIAALAPQKPNWNFVHLDFDKGMNSKARKKYQEVGLDNISILEKSAQEAHFTAGSFDLVLTTNAIYAIPEHEEILSKIHSWLAPHGKLIAVDFGRPQNTTDWMIYIARNLVKNKGIGETYRLFKENWEAAKQNRRTTKAQGQGNYWVHDHSEFKATLERLGFKVEVNEECYRGYSDLAVCGKS